MYEIFGTRQIVYCSVNSIVVPLWILDAQYIAVLFVDIILYCIIITIISKGVMKLEIQPRSLMYS